MKAIIAAAGQGKRLMPYTKDKPKSLVKLAGKAMIEYTLDTLLQCGIKKAVIIIGYHAEKYMGAIGTKYKDCDIKYIVNERYATTDNMTSLWMARGEIDEGFIFVNADVMTEKEIIRRLLDEPHPDVCVIDDEIELAPSSMKLKVMDDKIVAIDRNLTDGNARAIGMYKFSPEGGKEYFRKIESLLGTTDSKLQIEPPLQLFIKEHDLHVLRTKGMFWEEIDDEKDLKNAEKNLSKLLR
jgi:choline kinase